MLSSSAEKKSETSGEGDFARFLAGGGGGSSSSPFSKWENMFFWKFFGVVGTEFCALGSKSCEHWFHIEKKAKFGRPGGKGSKNWSRGDSVLPNRNIPPK